jgi:hypothetical protein
MDHWFDFSFNGQRAGWFHLWDDGREIAQRAVFTWDGHVMVNDFAIRRDGTTVTAWKAGDAPWTPVTMAGDRLPTSAFPLLAARPDGTWTYIPVAEGDGRDLPPVQVEKRAGVISERRDGTEVRRFVLAPDGFAEIHWGGGAVSRRMPDQATAQAGGPALPEGH